MNIDTYVSQLPELPRRCAEETLQLECEYMHHVQSLMIETSRRLLQGHAKWLKEHVDEVARRGVVLREAYIDWATHHAVPYITLAEACKGIAISW